MTKWRQELRWMRWAIARSDHEMRLDRWLRQQFPAAPQSLLQAQLRKRKIRILAPAQDPSDHKPALTPDDTASPVANTVRARANSVLREGLTVAVDAHVFRHKLQPAPLASTARQTQADKKSDHKLPLLQDLLARIVYTDDNYIVLDKPPGLAVQDGTGLESSLADYLAAIAQATAPAAQDATCRLVHRLDKETSGLLVLARSRLAAAKFTALVQAGHVRKTYRALVSASSAAERRALEQQLALCNGVITSPVDGKPATTLVSCAMSLSDPRGVWLELSLVTGRKHQLRVHCAHVLGAPIVGDTKYHGPRATRLFLHAERLEFPNPFALTRDHLQQQQEQTASSEVGTHWLASGDDSRHRCGAAPREQQTETVVIERPIDHVYLR